jgi:hypothetical protein
MLLGMVLQRLWTSRLQSLADNHDDQKRVEGRHRCVAAFDHERLGYPERSCHLVH